jgi:Tol biopolymer transport system component
MRKVSFITIAALLTLTTSSAIAAPKQIAMQVGSILNASQYAEIFLQSGRNSVFIANTSDRSADITLTAIDLTGTQSWQRIVDGGGDEVATASAVDAAGNIWLAGASSASSVAETQTPTSGIDNPDEVRIFESQTVRTEMKNLAIWKISAAGELTATYTSQLTGVPMVSALSINSTGITLVGALNSRPFLITSSLTGEFGKTTFIGTQKTTLNAVIRNPDGSINLFGSSAETLGGKKVAGIRDGVLIKVSKSGAITSVVRSSAIKATRSWNSADSSLLLTGPVVTGKKIETAITKFTTAFAPTWTARYASTGISIATSGGGLTC